jgi:hypothetical protein
VHLAHNYPSPIFFPDKKAATALKAEGVVLGALDATAHQAVAGRIGVQGYPTLKFYNNGKAVEYTVRISFLLSMP